MQVKERTERKLEKSGRITPREVLEAYEETGLKPTQGALMKRYEPDADYRACGLGVLMVRDGVDPYCGGAGTYLEKYPYHYQRGFANGFDDAEHGNEDRLSDYRKGYRDGRRVRRFVFSS